MSDTALTGKLERYPTKFVENIFNEDHIMAVENETVLMKLLEELKVEVKEARKDLTDLKVGQARLEVGQDATNSKLNTQTTWLLSILTALVAALITAVGKFAFFPNP